MNHHDQISKFVAKIRSRLNRFRLIDGLIWSIMVVAAILTLLCIYYIARGYAVPRVWFAVAGVLALVGGLVAWVARLWSKNNAAHYADQFFDLKDSVGTALSFHDEKREGEFIALQEQTTADKIKGAKPSAIRYNQPSRVLGAAIALVLLCSLMAFKKASPAIVEKQRVEEETNSRTAEIKDALEEAIEELEKEIKKDPNSEVDTEELKKWVDKLEQTKDQKEAMRQYAQLERKLQDAAKKLDQRKNEKLLTKAGKEIQKDAENRALGKKLEDKKFSEAAEDLKKLKPTKLDNKKLSEKKKQLARLKAATKRMSAASKAANRKSQSNPNNAKSGKPSESKNSEKMASSKSNNGKNSELDEKIAQLAESLSEYEGALTEAELQEAQLGEIDPSKLSECEACKGAVLGDLDDLAKLMKMIGKKTDAKNKLLMLSKKVGQCQSFCQGQSPSLGQNPGGKQAGVGSVESRREGTDPLVDNGQTSQLRGQKGAGPSQSTVEDAADGSGVSNLRSNTKRQIEFSKQIESYVQREDVPDHVKEGVKTYFENIHQNN